MSFSSRVKTALFGAEPISIRRLAVLLIAMGLAGLTWTVAMGVFGQPLPHHVGAALWIGGALLGLIFAGVAAVYYERGIVIGWLAGAAFFLGFVHYFYQDYSLTWYENLYARASLSAVLAAAGVAVGGPIGFVLKRVRSPANE